MGYRQFAQDGLDKLLAAAAVEWPDPGTPDPKDVDAVFFRNVIVSTNPLITQQIPLGNNRQRNDKQLQQLCVAYLLASKKYHEGKADRNAAACAPVYQAILSDPSNAVDSVTTTQQWVDLFNAKFLAVWNPQTAADFNAATPAFEKSLYDPMQAAWYAAQARFLAVR